MFRQTFNTALFTCNRTEITTFFFKAIFRSNTGSGLSVIIIDVNIKELKNHISINIEKCTVSDCMCIYF